MKVCNTTPAGGRTFSRLSLPRSSDWLDDRFLEVRELPPPRLPKILRGPQYWKTPSRVRVVMQEKCTAFLLTGSFSPTHLRMAVSPLDQDSP